jgi:hypothetical protein
MTTPTTTASSRSCPEPGPAGAHTAHTHTRPHVRTLVAALVAPAHAHTRTCASCPVAVPATGDPTSRTDMNRGVPTKSTDQAASGRPGCALTRRLSGFIGVSPPSCRAVAPGVHCHGACQALSVCARLRAVLSPRRCIGTAPVRLSADVAGPAHRPAASLVTPQLSGSSRSFGHRVRHPLGFRPSNRSPPCRAQPPPIRLRQPAGRPG